MKSKSMTHSDCLDDVPGTQKWIRLPTRGLCPYTSLSRATYYQLIKDGKIKSASLKKPGCLTGVRLVWLPSVLDYIERHVESPMSQ